MSDHETLRAAGFSFMTPGLWLTPDGHKIVDTARAFELTREDATDDGEDERRE
jgi:hypothetical protein